MGEFEAKPAGPVQGAPVAQEHSFMDDVADVVGFIPGLGVPMALGRALAHANPFGHLFDDGPAHSDPATAAKKIGDSYMSIDEADDALRGVDPDSAFGKIDTKQDALKSINGMTQYNYDDQSKSPHYCGPTAILAGAMYGGGHQGVDAIIKQIEADEKASAGTDKDKLVDAQANAAMLDQIRKRADADGMKQGDIQALQGELYKTMRERMQADPSVPQANKDAEGIDQATMKKYISQNPELAKIYKDNNMSVGFIDSGTGAPDHYTLDIGGDKPMVYDPNPRKDRNQLVTDPDQVQAYQDTKHIDIAPP